MRPGRVEALLADARAERREGALNSSFLGTTFAIGALDLLGAGSLQETH